MSQARALAPDAIASEEANESYILFSLGAELYGTPLLSVREVIKLGEVKTVPYMVSHFRGVINLRGQIVSVIDLRVKFNLTPEQNKKNMILIIETAGGLLGAIIDDLVSVEHIAPGAVDSGVGLETKIPLEFFLGIGKTGNRLVNLVNLAGCLSSEDLRIVKSNRELPQGK